MTIKRGTKKPDLLKGTSTNDSIYGLKGDDTLKGLGGNDKLFGGEGNDKMFGGKGQDTLDGGTGDDQMFGGNGDDLFIGGLGNDTIDGGVGLHDKITYANEYSVTPQLIDGVFFVSGVAVDLVKGTARKLASGTTDKIMGVEDVVGSGYGDLLVGDDKANIIEGGKGSDGLAGGGGNDTLSGGDDLDFLRGGGGSDELAGGRAADYFMFGALTDSGVGTGSSDVITDFQKGIDKINLSEIDAVSFFIRNQFVDVDPNKYKNTGDGDQAFTFIGKSPFASLNAVMASSLLPDNGEFTNTYKFAEVRFEYIAASDTTLIQINAQKETPTLKFVGSLFDHLNADTTVDMEIRLKGEFNLTADDFIL